MADLGVVVSVFRGIDGLFVKTNTRLPHFWNLSTTLLYMSMKDEKQPTIANPFEHKVERQFVPAARREPRKDTISKLYQPSFYVSYASKDLITAQVEQEKINVDELETIYKISYVVGKIFGRTAPTYSDIKVALTFRTIDYARQVAAGEEQMDIIRHDLNTLEVMNKKDRLLYWKIVAERLITEYDNPENQV
jgi:hypothetical protein